MSRKIAFFDFDGTITTKDTLLEFIKFSKGTGAFYMGFLKHLPSLLAFKLKLIPNQKAKEKILKHFFAGTPLEIFNAQCHRFSKEMIPSLLRPAALREIQKLKEENYTLVLVSASPENWIAPWATGYGFEVMGTRLETKEGKLTGNIIGNNCYGDEKVCRIKEKFDPQNYTHIAAYGDSGGDKQMLALANNSYYKPFREA